MARPLHLVATLALASATPAAAQGVGYLFFQTPSGNIACMALPEAGGAWVDCEIAERASRAPALPRPADCDLEWGDRFSLSETGPGLLGCHGDTVRDPAARVLPYGGTLAIGTILCASSEAGLECRNPEGHGFFLSRARQAVF